MNNPYGKSAILPLVVFTLLFVGCGEIDDESRQELSTEIHALQAPCGETTQTTLLAGQFIEAGTVDVANDEEYLFVTFRTSDGWTLAETHVAVGASLDDLPQTQTGNPIPGQFQYSATHDDVTTYTYTIPLGTAQTGDELFIAAHAVVRLALEEDVFQVETGWGEGPQFPGRNWAMYFSHTVQECEDAVELEFQGCTPGYWRQSHHYDSWQSYAPSDFFDDVFDREVDDELTLGEAVQLGGGDLNALIRHSVAALLNAASDDVDYPFTEAEVIGDFQAAFDGGEYEETKDVFDDANNLGCPL